MIRILLTAACCCGVSALLGHFLLPVLRAAWVAWAAWVACTKLRTEDRCQYIAA